MTWFKTDDGFPEHPKVVGISFGAEGLWHRAGCWCSAKLTDGRIPKRLMKAWHAPPELVAELVELGLWIEEPDGWRFHDFLDYQPSKDRVLKDREAAQVRMNRVRSSRELQPNTKRSSATPVPVPVPVSSEDSLTLPTTTTSPSFAPENDRSGGSIEIGPKGTEHEGYRWLHEVLGTFPADLASWRADYAVIGAKPAAERLQVARNVQATAWLMEKRSRATPGHLRKHWASFLEGPRNFDQPKPIVAMDFKSQREAAQKAYTKQRLDAFDASEKAFIAMAKTEAERKLRESDWQERRIRLDRSLP